MMIAMTDQTAKAAVKSAQRQKTALAFSIRDAVEADFAVITEIYAHHVRTGLASFEEEEPGRDEMLRRFGEVRKVGLPYLAAVSTGPGASVLGYAYATPYRARSAYRFSIENSVYVRDGLAGGGIGRALLAALIARCEAGPWRQMIAIIGNSVHAASIALHAAAGFRRVGTLQGVGFKHGRWVDTVLMQCELGSGAATLPNAPK
jgi:L-amino acid N-acyltransferase YncA